MAKRKALGRGMSAILPDSNFQQDKESSASSSPTEVFRIPLKYIERNRYQPRQEFDEEGLKELAKSIEVHDVIQPITVRKLGDKAYELISGERRLRASKLANLKDIPAYVREANDEQMLEMALIENIQREDLNPIEIALSYNRLIEELSIDQKNVGDKVGKERSTVTNYLSLLKLSEAIKKSIREREISMGHAKSLKGFSDQDVPDLLLDIILRQHLSVRQTESISRELKKLPDSFLQKTLLGEIEDKEWSVKQVQDYVKKALSRSEEEKEGYVQPDRNEIVLRELSRKLEEKFGNKIKLKQNDEGKGEIAIPFSSHDDLNRILEILDV